LETDRKLQCPLCQKECEETYIEDEKYVHYFCFNCGYATDLLSENGAVKDYLDRNFPQELQPFVKSVRFPKESGAKCMQPITWYPTDQYICENDEVTIMIEPIAKNGKLHWRRFDIVRKLEEENDHSDTDRHRILQHPTDYTNLDEAKNALTQQPPT